MASYNAAAIVGKTLRANTAVQLKRLPADSAPVIFTVKAGQPVGTVFSYILPGTNNSRLYWMFKDETGRNYYAEHQEGRFNISALKEQGVPTTQQETTAAAQANEPITKFIERNITKIALIAAGALVLKSVIPGLLKR